MLGSLRRLKRLIHIATALSVVSLIVSTPLTNCSSSKDALKEEIRSIVEKRTPIGSVYSTVTGYKMIHNDLEIEVQRYDSRTGEALIAISYTFYDEFNRPWQIELWQRGGAETRHKAYLCVVGRLLNNNNFITLSELKYADLVWWY